MGFWTGIFCAYPHIVMGIVIASTDGFSPIRLDGVVKSDGTSDAMAELPVVYTLKFPSKYCSNNQVMYLKIACGAGVLVNFLIGNPFLRSAKANLCFETNTFHCANLDHIPGFPLTYKKPELTAPAPPRVGTNLVVSEEVLNDIKAISMLVGFPPSLPVVAANPFVCQMGSILEQPSTL